MALKLVEKLVAKGLVHYDEQKTKADVNAEIRRMILEGTISPNANDMQQLVDRNLSPFSDEAKVFKRMRLGATKTMAKKKAAAIPKRRATNATKKKTTAKPRKKTSAK